MPAFIIIVKIVIIYNSITLAIKTLARKVKKPGAQSCYPVPGGEKNRKTGKNTCSPANAGIYR
jgi:hypothetical protein